MNEAQYFTQQYEEDEGLTEAFEQLRAIIGDTLDTHDVRGFEEDEDADEHKPDLSNQSTSSQFHVTYDPVVTVLRREWDDLHKRVDDLERQRDDLAAVLSKIFYTCDFHVCVSGHSISKIAAAALKRLEGDERE